MGSIPTGGSDTPTRYRVGVFVCVCGVAVLLVACCPTGVPGAAWGPGCFVCPWAAARPRAVRAASFARRVVSKPGQAPPPPTGTAAWPSGPSGALHTSDAWLLMCGLARRLKARPGPATAHRHRGQAFRSLRRPPHQWCPVAVVWLGASSQGPPWPCHRPSISHVIPLRLVQTLNLHRWNCNVFAWSRKVTAGNYVRLLVSVGSAAAFGCWGRTLRPFMRSSSLRRWGFCTTRSLLAACRRRVEPSCSAIPPDWCRRQPRVSRLGPADQAARLSETPVAFAGAGRASTETVRSSPVEWCNRFVSFGLGYALSWSGVSSCPVGCGVSRDLVRMSRLR